MHGLDCYDYGTRNYDPVLSRFTTIDPLAEKYYSISFYAYCAGNPVMFVDPDGREIYICYKDENEMTILSVTHNRPGGTGPSGFSEEDKSGDKFVVGNFLISHKKTVKRFVYITEGTLIPYNNKSKGEQQYWFGIFTNAKDWRPKFDYPGIGLPPK